MRERELTEKITGLAIRAQSVKQLLDSVATLLTGEFGSAILFLRPLAHGRPLFTEPGLSDFNVAQFLESRDYPFRGVYTARVVHRGRPHATLVACFGTWGSSGEILHRVTSLVAEQIGEIVVQTVAENSALAPSKRNRHAA